MPAETIYAKSDILASASRVSLGLLAPGIHLILILFSAP